MTDEHFCPKCGRNYPPNVQWCEHCAVKLEDANTVETTSELFKQDTVTVHIAENPLQAELLREILESNGIMSTLVGEVPSSVFPFTVDGLARVRVIVLQSAADEATKIINDAIAAFQTAKIEPEEDEDEDSDSQ